MIVGYSGPGRPEDKAETQRWEADKSEVYDLATESDRRLFLVTFATVLAYVATVAVGSLGVVLAVGGRPAGFTLIAVAAFIAAVAWGLHRTEQRS